MSRTINLHQLKAGGKTLEGIFHREYGSSVCYISKLPPKSEKTKVTAYPDKIKALSDEEREGIELLTGHMFFGMHELFESSSRYISLLREPESRLVSYYYYLLKSHGTEINRVIIEKKLDLDSFLLLTAKEIERLGFASHAAFELNFMLENGQSKFISGLNPGEGKGAEELYEVSLRNIREHFEFVGLTERFDESIIAFKKLLKWRFPLCYFKTNVTESSKKEGIRDPQTLNIVRERNWADIKLYRHIESEFNHRIKEVVPSISMELLKLRFMNRLFSFYLFIRRRNR